MTTVRSSESATDRLSGLRAIVLSSRRLLAQRNFRAVLACCMVMGLATSFVAPFLSMFGTREVSMSLAQFGAFMTTTTLANILIATVLSHRSDTMYSRRTMLLASAGSGLLGYLGYAFTREIWLLLLLGGGVLGVASLAFSQLFAYARELVERSDIPASEAPLAMSTFRMAVALSWTVGPALAALTLQHFGFEGLFLTAALLHLLLFVLVHLSIPAAAPIAAAASAPAVSLRAVLTRPGVLPWFCSFVLLFAAQTISMGNLPLLVLNELAGRESQVGIAFSLAPLFELPFMLYVGFLATRMDAGRLIRAAIIVALLYYGALSQVRAPWHIYPLQLLSAALVSVTGGVAITFFQNKLPGQFGAATNLYVTAMRIGSTSGYLLFGGVAARFGHRGAYVACAVLALAALLLTALTPRDSSAA